MRVELTVVLRFTDGYPPSAEDIEYAFDCDVVEYELEEDV